MLKSANDKPTRSSVDLVVSRGIVRGDADRLSRARGLPRETKSSCGAHEVHPRPAGMAIEAGASGRDRCERRSVSTSGSRARSLPTSSSPITSRLIATRLIANRPMATAPNAAAEGESPIAVGPRRPGPRASSAVARTGRRSIQLGTFAVEATYLLSIAQRSPPVHQRAS